MQISAPSDTVPAAGFIMRQAPGITGRMLRRRKAARKTGPWTVVP